MSNRKNKKLALRYFNNDSSVAQFKSKKCGDMWYIDNCPNFSELVEWRVSVAIVEGKPVFLGDKLWIINPDADDYGSQYTIDEDSRILYPDNLSWNPHKPKSILDSDAFNILANKCWLYTVSKVDKESNLDKLKQFLHNHKDEI